jgi:hypothetical protein
MQLERQLQPEAYRRRRGRLPGSPTDPVRRRIQGLSDAEDAHGGSVNGLAGGAGAAAGPLHPAADRPLSRPPGRSHAAPGPRQGRVASCGTACGGP